METPRRNTWLSLPDEEMFSRLSFIIRSIVEETSMVPSVGEIIDYDRIKGFEPPLALATVYRRMPKLIETIYPELSGLRLPKALAFAAGVRAVVID